MNLKRNYFNMILIAVLLALCVLLRYHSNNSISSLQLSSDHNATTSIKDGVIPYDDREVFEFNFSKGEEKINLTPGLVKDLNTCEHIVLSMNTTAYGSYEYRLNILKRLVPHPEQFLKEFKNPCWYANYTFPKEFDFIVFNTVRQKLPLSSDLELLNHVFTKRDSEPVRTLQCLPYFYLVGFSKCGTTALMYYIKHMSLLVEKKHTGGLFTKFLMKRIGILLLYCTISSVLIMLLKQFRILQGSLLQVMEVVPLYGIGLLMYTTRKTALLVKHLYLLKQYNQELNILLHFVTQLILYILDFGISAGT